MELILFLQVFALTYIFLLLQIFLHELGHLLFGKLSGYRFLSFRVWHLTWILQNGVLRLRRSGLPGTAGQCLIVPPDDDWEHMPYALFLRGGAWINLLAGLISLVCLFVFLGSWGSPWLLSTLTVTGFMAAFQNGVPMKIQGIPNDGFQIREIKRSPLAKRSVWLQLRIQKALADGVRLRDLPEEWFSLPAEVDFGNTLVCCIAYLQCCRALDTQDIETSRALHESILAQAVGLCAPQKNELLCEFLFYEILGERRPAVIAQLLTPALKKYIRATRLFPSRQRLLYAYDLLVSEDHTAAQRRLLQFEKRATRSAYPGEIPGERERIEQINQAAQQPV